MKSRLKEILIPTFVLFIVCVITTALLAIVNYTTKKPIADAEEKAKNESMKKVIANATDFKDDGKYYTATENGKTVGYVFITEESGYGGPVSVMTGISPSGEITGVTILSSDETPGLGKKAENADFTDRYNGKKGKLTVAKGSAGDNEILAITGATITSTAVTNAVDQAIDIFEKEVGKSE